MNIIHAGTVGSTNDELKKLALGGAVEGTVLIAGRQTAGRGRLGRSFESAAGMGAYVSILLRPEEAEELSGLTCAAATAVRRVVIDATGLACGIKWTNDLVINGKKLCGILTEYVSGGSQSRDNYAIIGAGLNINQAITDFSEELREKATSLFIETGIKNDCRQLAEAMAVSIYSAYKELGTKRAEYMDEYRRRCINIGKTVEFTLKGVKRRGAAEAVGDDGALLIRLENGELFTLRFGEASIV
jgi:BirA family biotin operon repressor/biotin-[acetyl-CoA-carboxylase] ligase